MIGVFALPTLPCLSSCALLLCATGCFGSAGSDPPCDDLTEGVWLLDSPDPSGCARDLSFSDGVVTLITPDNCSVALNSALGGANEYELDPGGCSGTIWTSRSFEIVGDRLTIAWDDPREYVHAP